MSGIKQRLDRFFLGPFYYQFLDTLKKEAEGNETLLDIGCGYNPAIKVVTSKMKRAVGMDAFMPSIEKARKDHTHTDFILGDVMQDLSSIKSKSYDVVMALDLIEHLEKEKGYWLIEQMERIAKKKVIIFTPNGFVPQQPYDNNPWQEHKSGWDWKEMQKMDFRVLGFGGYKKLRGERFAIKYKPRIFWKYISFYSQVITHRWPKFAYGILCVKELR